MTRHGHQFCAKARKYRFAAEELKSVLSKYDFNMNDEFENAIVRAIKEQAETLEMASLHEQDIYESRA